MEVYLLFQNEVAKLADTNFPELTLGIEMKMVR